MAVLAAARTGHLPWAETIASRGRPPSRLGISDETAPSATHRASGSSGIVADARSDRSQTGARIARRRTLAGSEPTSLLPSGCGGARRVGAGRLDRLADPGDGTVAGDPHRRLSRADPVEKEIAGGRRKRASDASKGESIPDNPWESATEDEADGGLVRKVSPSSRLSRSGIRRSFLSRCAGLRDTPDYRGLRDSIRRVVLGGRLVARHSAVNCRNEGSNPSPPIPRKVAGLNPESNPAIFWC